MAINRKLGKTTDIRLAMLKSQVTDLILHGKIETTEARAKEVKAIADSIIALAVKEKDNFETATVKVSKAKLDSKGNKVTELVKSKNGKEYLKVVKEETTEKRQKDMPSRLNARRKMMKTLNKVKDSEGNNIDLSSKLFNEIAPKYEGRVGGYTRILKLGQRKRRCSRSCYLTISIVNKNGRLVTIFYFFCIMGTFTFQFFPNLVIGHTDYHTNSLLS